MYYVPDYVPAIVASESRFDGMYHEFRIWIFTVISAVTNRVKGSRRSVEITRACNRCHGRSRAFLYENLIESSYGLGNES